MEEALEQLSTTVLLALSHLYRCCLLVSVACRLVVLAYLRKCAADEDDDDAAALLKMSYLL